MWIEQIIGVIVAGGIVLKIRWMILCVLNVFLWGIGVGRGLRFAHFAEVGYDHAADNYEHRDCLNPSQVAESHEHG